MSDFDIPNEVRERTGDQHDELRLFKPPFEFDLHPYVREYLVDTGVVG